MRILIMADVPANPDSGAAGTEYQTILALRRLGHEVDTVWADDMPHRIRHGNLHYLLELPFAYRSRMLQRLRSRPYDVVHVNQPHGYLAARAVSGRRSAPVFVHRSHGLESRVRAVLAPWTQRYGKRRPILKHAASQVMEIMLEINNRGIGCYADGHIVSASLCGDFLHERYAVPRDQIAVIPQAAPKLFQDTAVVPNGSRSVNRLLYVGQFAFFKAPMVLAATFEQILAKYPEASLTWVCDGKDHKDAAALFNIRARAHVEFLEWIPQDRLIEIYDAHGIFLFPSFFEGFGKAFLEAMARGLVVIASREGGAKDIIENGHNGLLVPVGDSAAMAAACATVLSAPELARELGTNARQTALRYTWDRVAQDTIDFYRRLIKKKSRKA